MEVSNPFVRANTALNRPMQRLGYIPSNSGISACLGVIMHVTPMSHICFSPVITRVAEKAPANNMYQEA